MSINYPLLNKTITKKKTLRIKENNPKTISSDFRSKKHINLDDLFGGFFYNTRNKNHKKFSGNDIMKEALQIGKRLKTESKAKSKESTYIKYADELIQNTQISARNNYIENISQKFKLNLHNNFKNELIKSTEEGVDELQIKLDSIDKTKQKYEMALNENARLEQKLVDINNDLRLISHELYEKNELINKEQIKNEAFKIIQPIFEELIREFPDEEPKELISSFRRNKEKYLSQIHELNKLNMKINEIENERKKNINRNKAFQNNINNKIAQQKILTDSMTNHFEKEFKIYKDEYEILKNYKQENIFLKQLLYNIYLWIKGYIHPKKYEIFTKKLGYDPLKRKKNFDITIFNHKEFVSMVNENMLSNVKPCYDGVLLRETIVFGNYLVRRHLKQKINKYRYDPVGAFREIKSAIDAKEFENYQLSGVIKNLKQKNINSYLKIKELEHQVQKAKIKFQSLLTKFEKYIKLTNKIKSKKTSVLTEINKEEKKIRSTSAYPTVTDSSYTETKSINTLYYKKGTNEEEDVEEKSVNLYQIDKNKKKKANKTMDGFYNVNKKFFLTNDGQNGKNKKKRIETTKGDDIKTNINVNKKRFKTESNKNNDLYDSSVLNSIDKEIIEEMKNKSINDNKLKNFRHKKFNDLQMSKNRDKLIKTNGFNGTENLLMNIKNIMNELMYSETPKAIIDKSKDDNIIEDKKRYESIREDKNDFPYLDRIKDLNNFKYDKSYKTLNNKFERPLTSVPQITYGKNYNDISNKIMSDIDTIIEKMNDIDLHDFSTDQNYKDKRKLNLFTKVDKEKIEKKNSIDSLLIRENSDSSIDIEETEEEEEIVEQKNEKGE